MRTTCQKLLHNSAIIRKSPEHCFSTPYTVTVSEDNYWNRGITRVRQLTLSRHTWFDSKLGHPSASAPRCSVLQSSPVVPSLFYPADPDAGSPNHPVIAYLHTADVESDDVD